jgi:hypothetical protein
MPCGFYLSGDGRDNAREVTQGKSQERGPGACSYNWSNTILQKTEEKRAVVRTDARESHDERALVRESEFHCCTRHAGQRHRWAGGFIAALRIGNNAAYVSVMRSSRIHRRTE